MGEEEGGERGGGGERGWSVWELVQINFLPIGGNPTRKSTHTSHRQRHRTSPLFSPLHSYPALPVTELCHRTSPTPSLLPSPALPHPHPLSLPRLSVRLSVLPRRFVRRFPALLEEAWRRAVSYHLDLFFSNTHVFFGEGVLSGCGCLKLCSDCPAVQRRSAEPFFFNYYFFASCTRSDTRGCCYVP